MSEQALVPSEQPAYSSGGAGMEVEINLNEQLSRSTDVEEDTNKGNQEEEKELLDSYLERNTEQREIIQDVVPLNDHISRCVDDDGDAILFAEMSKHLENIKNLAMKEERDTSVEKQNTILQGSVASSMINKERHRADQMMQQKQNELNTHAQMQKEEFEMRLKSKELSLQQREQELRESDSKINFLQNRLASKEQEIVELVQLSQKLSNSLDEQKKIFEKKLWKVQEDQDYTGQVNGEWKGQLSEQKILTEDLTRKVLSLESRIARERKDADSLAEKNFSLANQNQDLQAENESLKSQIQLLNAEKRQKDSIFDEYGSQQNQFISILANYQKDLKDVFTQINTNPIIERYKRQNDELILENAELRNQILKFTEEIDLSKNIEGESKAQSGEKFEQDVNCALEVYQSMMAKFTEMDERMMQNDNEKFEALQQKDFWFQKAQNLEADLESAKEQVKGLQGQQESLQAEISKLASKKVPLQTITNNKTKRKQNNTTNSNNKITTNNSDIEDDIVNTTTPNTERQLKIKTTDFEEILSPQNNENNNNNNNNTTNSTNNANTSNNSIPMVSTNQIIAETQPPKQPIHAPQPAGPLKNVGLFQLRVCVSCFLTIKKMQMFENCQNCHKDYHTKCKGDSIIGAFCNSCYEKQKKKAEIEIEKAPIAIPEAIIE